MNNTKRKQDKECESNACKENNERQASKLNEEDKVERDLNMVFTGETKSCSYTIHSQILPSNFLKLMHYWSKTTKTISR